jgi:hypothetical protein
MEAGEWAEDDVDNEEGVEETEAEEQEEEGKSRHLYTFL